MSLTSLGDGSKWTTNSLLQSNSKVQPAALLNHFQIYILHIFLLEEVLLPQYLPIKLWPLQNINLDHSLSTDTDQKIMILHLGPYAPRQNDSLLYMTDEEKKKIDRKKQRRREREREGTIAREMWRARMKGNQSRIPMRGEGDLLWLIILQPTMRRNNLVNVNSAEYSPNAVSRCGILRRQPKDDVTLPDRCPNDKQYVMSTDGPQIKSALMSFNFISGQHGTTTLAQKSLSTSPTDIAPNWMRNLRDHHYGEFASR